MTRVYRAAAAVLASVTLLSALVGCTKTAVPAAPSPSPTPAHRLVASASPAPGGGDFSDGDN